MPPLDDGGFQPVDSTGGFAPVNPTPAQKPPPKIAADTGGFEPVPYTPEVPMAGEKPVTFESGLHVPKSPPLTLDTGGFQLVDPTGGFEPVKPVPSATGKALRDISKAAWSGIADTYSDDLGISRESFGKVMGSLDDPENRKGLVGNLRMLNYAIARTLSAPADIVFRSVPAAIEGSIRGFTQSLKEAGYNPDKADQLGGDLRMTADVSMAAFPEWESMKSLNEHVARGKELAARGIAEGRAIPQDQAAPQLTEGGAIPSLQEMVDLGYMRKDGETYVLTDKGADWASKRGESARSTETEPAPATPEAPQQPGAKVEPTIPPTPPMTKEATPAPSTTEGPDISYEIPPQPGLEPEQPVSPEAPAIPRGIEPIPPPVKTSGDFFEKAKADNQRQNERAQQLMAAIDNGDRVSVVDRSGNTVALSPSTRGGWQATTFENGQPVGHVLFESSDEAGKYLARQEPISQSTARSGAFVVTPSGRRVEVNHKLVDIGDLTASHDVDLNVNPAYPAELQPRARERVASQAQIAEIASRLDPALLGESPTADVGAPIIGSDKVVESGNGRILALRRAYEQNLPSAQRYRDWLAEQGHDASGMKMPVLVRERTTEMSPDERRVFTSEANQRTTLGMSDVEQANNDARFLSSQLLSLYQGGELTAAVNRPFISALAKLIPTAERADFVTADGALSQAGIRRLQNALFSRAWDSPELLSALREDQDTNIRAIGGAMTDAAPAWAAMRANLAESGRSNLDATPAIINAINMVKKARDDGQPIKMMVFQDDMFGGRADPAVENALKIFFKDDDFKRQRSRPDMAEGLRYIAAEAEKAQEGPGLFADIPQVGITDLLEANARRGEGGLLPGTTSSRAVEAGDVMPESGASSLQAMQPGARYVAMRQDVFDPSVPRTDGDLVRREKIISDLSKALNVPIYRGRVKGKGRLGFFRPKIEEVRIKRQNDIEVVSHEIAHMLDDRYPEIRQTWTPKTPANNAIRQELAGVSYDKSKLYEGFAEFTRLWASQKAEAQIRAPQFFSWFESWLDRNPQVATSLRKSQADIHAWFDQNALDRMQSKIGVEKSWEGYLDGFGDRFRQTAVDYLQGVYRMEHEITGEINPGGAYETARLVAGSRAITEGALRWGVPTIMSDGRTSFVGKGLEQVLSPIVKRLDDWILYAVGRSASELKGQARENLFSQAEIDAARALETPEFRQAFDDYQTWNKGVVDFAEKKGLIDPEKRAQWQRDMYLPFYRVVDPQGVQVGRGHTPTPGAWSGIKRLTGGTGNLRDIMGNIIQNASMLIEGGIEAEARRTIADLSQKERGAHFMAKIPKNSLPVKIGAEQVGKTIADSLGVPASDPMVRALTDQLEPMLTFFQHGQAPHGRNIVSVLRGGKAEYYEVADPILYRSLVAMRPPGKNAFLKLMSSTRRFIQGTITLHLNFLAAHLTRDAIQGWVLSENGFKPLFDSSRGVFSRLVEDENYRNFVANGGGLFGSHLDAPQWRKYLETYYGQRGIPYKLVVNTPRKMKYLVERIADAMGSGTRVGEYNRGIQAGLDPRHAALRAREIATDFALHGDRTGGMGAVLGFLADTVPFFNASIVSLDRLSRAVYRSEEARLKIASRLAALSAASIGLYMYNRTIPEYEQLPEWDKDLHWHFFIPTPSGDHLHFRMPKAWEIGLVATLAERTAAGIVRDETPESIPGQFLKAVMNFEHLDPFSGVFQPLIESIFNINLFTWRPLVSQSEMQLEPWARTHPGMHPALKKLGEMERDLPTSLQVPPTTMDAILHAYLGNYAETALMMSDRFMSPIAPPERRWDEVPVVRRFYQQEPAKSTQYVEDYYRALDAAASAHQTVRALAKEGKLDLAQKEVAKKAHELQTYPFLEQQNKVISAINKYRDAVLQAPDLKTLQGIAPTIAAAVGQSYKPMIGLKDKPAWNDVAKLKRVLVDALFQTRNDRVAAVMKTVNPPPEPLVPR